MPEAGFDLPISCNVYLNLTHANDLSHHGWILIIFCLSQSKWSIRSNHRWYILSVGATWKKKEHFKDWDKKFEKIWKKNFTGFNTSDIFLDCAEQSLNQVPFPSTLPPTCCHPSTGLQDSQKVTNVFFYLKLSWIMITPCFLCHVTKL